MTRNIGIFVLLGLAQAAVAFPLMARAQSGIKCESLHCSCDSPGVLRPCDFDCAALCGGSGGGNSGLPAVSLKQQLMMDTKSAFVQGLLEMLLSNDTAADDARLQAERQKLAEEEAKRHAKETRIAEAKRQKLASELKGFRRIDLAYKGRPTSVGGYKRDDPRELQKAALLCRARVSDEALDLALADSSGVSMPADQLRSVSVTELQARQFGELRRACQSAARNNAAARKELDDAEAGLNVVKHGLHLAQDGYQSQKDQKQDADQARRTFEDMQALAAKIEQKVQSAQTRANAAQVRLAQFQARQRDFACDPNVKMPRANDRNDRWCQDHPRPLKPSASILEVDKQDEVRWTAYRERMRDWCSRCAPSDQNCVPTDSMPPRHPPAQAGDSAMSYGPFGKTDPPCGAGQLTGPTGGDSFYCCPADYPYLSRCDWRCYSADAFNHRRIQCDESWSGTIRCQ